MGKKFSGRKALLWLGGAIAVLLAIYAAIAYAVEPILWRHFEHQSALAAMDLHTRTKLGIPGDAINVGLEGSRADVLCAMGAAGWSPADPVTWRSSIKIADSVLFNRRYPRAPVSDLYFDGRPQDLAFQKPSGKSPSKRHHVRFWKALDAGETGAAVWVGAATYDESVGVSHYTGQITHHIGADIDAERGLLSADLVAAKKAAATYFVSGVGPTLYARNGGGDPYFTDGEIGFVRLSPGCATQTSPPEALPSPPAAEAKNRAFGWFARAWRMTH